MTRRQVLGLGAVAAVAAAPTGARLLGLTGAAETSSVDGLGALAERVAALSDAPDQLRRLGERHLADRPGAPTEVDLLVGALPSGVVAASLLEADDETLRELLARAATEDLSAGRTVRVDDWLLAAAEADLCAFLALRASA